MTRRNYHSRMKLLSSVLGAAVALTPIQAHGEHGDIESIVQEERVTVNINYPGIDVLTKRSTDGDMNGPALAAVADCDSMDPSCNVQYQNIRIHVEPSGVTWDDEMKAAFETAINWLENTLKTVRMTTKLKYDKTAACQAVAVPEAIREGVDADFAIVVVSDGTKQCSESTLGWAVACARDQFNRPVVGLMNICPNSWAAPRRFMYKTAFFAHELMHAMGFSSSSLTEFIDVETMEAYASPSTTVQVSPTRTATYVTTPMTKTTVRKHFGCNTLEGAALEDEGQVETRGSHFDKRVFGNEGLTGAVSNNPIMSSITLAFMQDSGWYRPDFTNTPDLLWGRSELSTFLTGQQKCDFPNLAKSCIVDRKSQFGDYFCDTSRDYDSCTFDANSVSRCNLLQYNSALPADFQYFASNTLGGAAYYNYCPIFETYTEQSTGYDSFCFRDQQSSTQYFGELYGATSKCVDSTLIQDSLNELKTSPSRCYRTKCLINQQQSLEKGYLVYAGVEIDVNSDDGTATIPCMADETGKTKSVQAMRGSLKCPDVQKVCLGSPCVNGGIWRENHCACKLGYTGSYCQIENTKTNRSKVPSPFHYGSSGSTLIAGKSYTLPASAIYRTQHNTVFGSSTFDNISHYVAVTPLPKGLYVDKTTGAIKGVPDLSASEANGDADSSVGQKVAPTACAAYTVAAVGFKGEEYRTVVNLKVMTAGAVPKVPSTRRDAIKNHCEKVPAPDDTQITLEQSETKRANEEYASGPVDLINKSPYAKVLTASAAGDVQAKGVAPLVQAVPPAAMLLKPGEGTVYSHLANAAGVSATAAIVLSALIAARM